MQMYHHFTLEPMDDNQMILKIPSNNDFKMYL